MLSMLSVVPYASAATTTVKASADTFTEQFAAKRTNGAALTLMADENGSDSMRAYLKFAVPQLSGTVTRVQLRVFSIEGGGSTNGPVAKKTTTSWTEADTSWSNAPASGTNVGDFGAMAPGWNTVDITGLVTSTTAATLAIALHGDGDDGIKFASRETANAPQLVITTSEPTPPPPPPTPTTVTTTVKASADTFTEQSASSKSNAGATVLRVDEDAKAGMRAYLKFPVPTLSGSVTRVQLRVYVNPDGGTSNGPIAKKTSTDWSESAVTWTNAPASSTNLGNYGAMTPGWSTIDITNLVTSSSAATYAIALHGEGTDGINFASRETTNAPQLVITSSSTPSPAPTPSEPSTPVVPQQPLPAGAPGAALPISWSLSSLSGTVYYVATTGNDANDGSSTKPLKTLGAAVAKAKMVSRATIVVRGGTYRGESELVIPAGKAIAIKAYPNEVPVFDGSTTLSPTVSGSLASATYAAMPYQVSGYGVSFDNSQLVATPVAGRADQAWKSNGAELRQVTGKGAVVAGTFAVEGGKIWFAAADASSGMSVSNVRTFISIEGAGSSIEGLRVQRYSNAPVDQKGVIRIGPDGDNVTIRNVEVLDPALVGVSIEGGKDDVTENVTLERLTVNSANWIGLTNMQSTGTRILQSRFANANSFDEFKDAPKAGGLKFSRNRKLVINDSTFVGNHSYGIWLDQSNHDTVIANSTFLDNEASAVFFEISDKLLMVNNYVRSSSSSFAAIRAVGSSGVSLVANTVAGGAQPFMLGTDHRSRPGCSKPKGVPSSHPDGVPCDGSYTSDWDQTNRPLVPTMDWMPRLDLMVNNVFVAPTQGGNCSAVTVVCFKASPGGDPVVDISKMIHKADTARGIPQTRIDGNVYASAATLVVTNQGVSSKQTFTALSAFTTAMASKTGISGLEAAGLAGTKWANANGSSTAALTAQTASAPPISSADSGGFLTSGKRQYGADPSRMR